MIHAVIYGGRGGSGGYLRYLAGLLRTSSRELGVRVTLVCSPALVRTLGPIDPAVNIIPIELLRTPVSARIWEQTQLARLCRRLSADVVFFASGSVAAIPSGLPTVVPCHSLLYFDDAEYDKYRYSALWFRSLWRLRRRLRAVYPTAAGVIFFSRYSQGLVIRDVQGIRRSAVIPHGLESHFLADTPVAKIEEPPRNILYVSTITPYKHQWNVVRAVKRLRDQTGRRLPTVAGWRGRSTWTSNAETRAPGGAGYRIHAPIRDGYLRCDAGTLPKRRPFRLRVVL
jgi:glycosyltransferase involved in cell wall biosynthesis